MWITRCVYGHCDSNTKDVDKPRMRGVFFIGFPERKKELSRCENWVKACGRNDFTLDDIDDKTLICNLHFVGCCGPSYQYPDPIPYVPTSPSDANRRPQDNLVQPQQIVFPAISENISESNITNQQVLKSEHGVATLDSSFKTCSSVALQPNDREVSEYWYYSPSLEHNYNLPADSEPSRKRLASSLKYNQSLVKHPKLSNNGVYVEQIVIPRKSHVPMDETKQTHKTNKPSSLDDTTHRPLNKPTARIIGSSGSVVEKQLDSNTHMTTKKIKRKRKGKSKLFSYKKKTSVSRKPARDNLQTHPAPITFVNVRPQTQYVTDKDHVAGSRDEFARFRSCGHRDVVKEEFQDELANDSDTLSADSPFLTSANFTNSSSFCPSARNNRRFMMEEFPNDDQSLSDTLSAPSPSMFSHDYLEETDPLAIHVPGREGPTIYNDTYCTAVNTKDSNLPDVPQMDPLSLLITPIKTEPEPIASPQEENEDKFIETETRGGRGVKVLPLEVSGKGDTSTCDNIMSDENLVQRKNSFKITSEILAHFNDSSRMQVTNDRDVNILQDRGDLEMLTHGRCVTKNDGKLVRTFPGIEHSYHGKSIHGDLPNERDLLFHDSAVVEINHRYLDDDSINSNILYLGEESHKISTDDISTAKSLSMCKSNHHFDVHKYEMCSKKPTKKLHTKPKRITSDHSSLNTDLNLENVDSEINKMGELSFSKQNPTPDLILHTATNYSDGSNSLPSANNLCENAPDANATRLNVTVDDPSMWDDMVGRPCYLVISVDEKGNHKLLLIPDDEEIYQEHNKSGQMMADDSKFQYVTENSLRNINFITNKQSDISDDKMPEFGHMDGVETINSENSFFEAGSLSDNSETVHLPTHKKSLLASENQHKDFIAIEEIDHLNKTIHQMSQLKRTFPPRVTRRRYRPVLAGLD